jgi:hypothetical protein
MTNTVSSTVSDEVLDSGIQIESGGRVNIKAATSSALGLAQFINKTWLDIVKKHRPDVMRGKTQQQVLNMRLDPSFSIEMMARLWEDNQRMIGMKASPGDLYLAHFLGPQAAKNVFRADPSTSSAALVGSGAVKANQSIFVKYKTAASLRKWASDKMASNGGHGYVKKYYRGEAMAMNQADLITDVSAQKRVERPDLPEGFHGDLDLYDTQIQLLAMNYDSGLMDGLWGSKTSGAISAFINDRKGFMPAPTSIEQFHASRQRLQDAIDKAEQENFKRPVKIEREMADPATVAEVAPEVVPVKRSFWASLWGSITAFFIALGDTIWSYAGQAWDFITNNKDSVPDSVKDPSYLSQLFHKVPPAVWVFLGAAILGFIAWNARKSMKKITSDVQSGVR